MCNADSNWVVKVLLDWGVLLEATSIILVAPLTAALVERDRKRRLYPLRKSAAFRVYREYAAIAGAFKRAMIQLELLTSPSEHLMDIVYRDGLEAAKNPDKLTSADSALKAVEYASTVHKSILASASRELFEGLKACDRFNDDAFFYKAEMDPEELMLLDTIRTAISETARGLQSWDDNIMCEFRLEKKSGLGTIDFDKSASSIIEFFENYGQHPLSLPWYTRLIDRLTGESFENIQPVSDSERSDLIGNVRALMQNKLLVSVETQREVAEAFMAENRTEKYARMRTDILSALSDTVSPK